jgi:hypothetical protein
MNREKFRQIIKESVSEILSSDNSGLIFDPRKSQLKFLIKNLIKEVMQTKKDKKTDDGSYDPLDVDNRTSLEKDRPQGKSFDQIMDKLSKSVKSIDKNIIVSFDDNKDFNVERPQAFRVRISPRWENNFDVEAMIEGNDRIKIVGLTIDQVIDFIKVNFTDSVKDVKKKSYEKVVDQTKDVSNKPKPDIDGTKGVSEYKPKEKIDKLPKKEEDDTGSPMKEVNVDELKKQREYSGNQVKPPKHKLDKELVIRMKGKKK